MEKTYDDGEAFGLLKAHDQAEDISGRITAAKPLLDEFLALANRAGWRGDWQMAGRQELLWISSPNGSGVFLFADEDGIPHLSSADHQERRRIEGIRYDSAERAFVSDADDTFYTPEPGKPRRKRSPMAVVAEAVIRHIDEQAASEPTTGR